VQVQNITQTIKRFLPRSLSSSEHERLLIDFVHALSPARRLLNDFFLATWRPARLVRALGLAPNEEGEEQLHPLEEAHGGTA